MGEADTPAASRPAIEAMGLSRFHASRYGISRSLEGVSLSVDRGEVVAVTGPSGSGKSTLLFLLAGLDEPDAGTARLAGQDWRGLKGTARADFRRRSCGFISQGMTLLPHATVAENVEVPLLLEGVEPGARATRVAAALEGVNLTDQRNKLPDQLSGGQQQRVAIARALVLEPAALLADEPTASLDSAAAQVISELLVDLAMQQGAAVILVTHDPAVARHAQRIVRLRSGRLADDIGDASGTYAAPQ